MADTTDSNTNLEDAIDQLVGAFKSNADREGSIRTVLGILSIMTEIPELRTVLHALELEPDVVGEMAHPARKRLKARYEHQIAEYLAKKRNELPDVLWDYGATTSDPTRPLGQLVLDVARMLDARGAPDPRWVECVKAEIATRDVGLKPSQIEDAVEEILKGGSDKPSQVQAAVYAFLEMEAEPPNLAFQATWKLLGTLSRLNLVDHVEDVRGVARSVVREWGDRGTREGREDNTTVNEAKRLIGILGKELRRRGHISEQTRKALQSAGENASRNNRRNSKPDEK